MSLLSLQYKSLYKGKILGANVTTPDAAFLDDWSIHDLSSTTIPMRILAMQYHQFRADAVDLGILNISGGKLHHNSSLPHSAAYETVTFYQSGLFSSNLPFSASILIDNNSLIGNIAIDATSIYIDLDDGQGYQSVTLGTPIPTNYITEEEKVLKLKYKDVSGNEVVHFHKVSVYDNTQNITNQKLNQTDSRGLPWGPFECNEGSGGLANPNNDTGCIPVPGEEELRVSVRRACGPGTDIRKPFIILDGIDLVWHTNRFSFADGLFNGDRLGFADPTIFPTPSPTTGTRLGDILTSSGYDIIFVDYSDHHLRIQDNAAGVEQLIRDLNGILDANGSDEPIRMMGISMGGLVGQYALLEMESNDEDHNVDKYFTFDSPMQGANVPAFLQGMLQHILQWNLPGIGPLREFEIEVPVFDETIGPNGAEVMQNVPILQFEENVLRSPAARQLAINNLFNKDHVKLNWDGVDMHTDFFSELDAFGELQDCETIAISNGSSQGESGRVVMRDGSLMAAGDLLFRLEIGSILNVSSPGTINLAASFLESEGVPISVVKFLPAISALIPDNIFFDIAGFASGGPQGTAIYNGGTSVSILFGLFEFLEDFVVENEANELALDSAPGGTIGLSAAPSIPFAGITNIETQINDLGGTLNLNFIDFCFIPAVSALDIQGTNANGDFMNDDLFQTGSGNPTTYARSTTQDTPFDSPLNLFDASGTLIKNNNHIHVTLTEQNVGFLITELIGNGDLTVQNNVINVSGEFIDDYNYGDSGLDPFTVPNPTSPNNNILIFGVTQNIFPASCIVPSGVDILVNDNSRIGLISNNNNPMNSTNSLFSVKTDEIDCSLGLVSTFESGSSLAVGDASANNIGEFIISGTHTVVFEQGSSIEIDSDSRIIVTDGASLVLEGIDLTIDNAEIIVEEGGTLQLVGPNNLQLLNDSRIHVKQGGTMELGDGYIANLDTDNSRIHVEGILIMDTEVLTATGTGFYHFDYGSLSTLRDDLMITRNGDLNNILMLIHGFIELDDVNIRVQGAAIEGGLLGTANSTSYSVIDSKVIETHLRADDVNNQTVTGSELIYASVESYDGTVLNLLNSDLHESTNVKAVRTTFVTATDVNFFGVSAIPISGVGKRVAVSLVDIDNFAVFTDCHFTPRELNTPLLNLSTIAYNDRPHAIQCHVTEDTESPFNLIIDNSQIDFFDEGIEVFDNDFDLGINVFLRNETVIQGCRHGISMSGNANSGMVDIDCASLIDNFRGVIGQDILLNIDAVLHAASGDGTVRPNTFINHSAVQAALQRKLFEICYLEKDIEGDIPAKGNYWDLTDPIANINIEQSSNNALCFPEGDIDLDRSDEVTQLPTGCPPPSGIITPGCPNSPLSVNDVPNFNGFSQTSNYPGMMTNTLSNLCLSTIPCSGDLDIHSYYWAGRQCLFDGTTTNYLDHFYQVALSQYESGANLPILCKQEALVAEHIIGTANPSVSTNYTLPVAETLCTNDNSSVFFLLDASGSVSNEEYSMMVTSVINTIIDISGPNVKYSVANFSTTYDRMVDLTSSLGDTSLIMRTLTGGTDVKQSFNETKLYIDNLTDLGKKTIILYTDAEENDYGYPNYDTYDILKGSTYDCEIITIRYQSGGNDFASNAFAAGISSIGGSYDGPIINSPNDPEGLGGPRKLIMQDFTNVVPLSSGTILNCDSLTVTIPFDCANPSITWTSSGDGVIFGNSIDVTSILTNGVGEYTVTIVCSGGCAYEDNINGSGQEYLYESLSPLVVSNDRYRYGVRVVPKSFESTTSVFETDLPDEINLYPNPVNETLTLDGIEKESQVTILDTKGRSILTGINDKSVYTMNLSNLKSGLYIVQIKKDGEQTNKRFVKL